MAFESLSEKLSAAFKKIRSKGKLSENDISEAMREVRMALLAADVSLPVVKDFTKTLTEKAIGQKVMESLTPAQAVIKIVDEELTNLMGSEHVRLKRSNKPPTVIMMCGLQGAGKTTHSAKIAKMLKKQGNRPLLVACDIYRPAAIKQLQIVGEQAGVPVFEMGTEKPEKIAKKALKHAQDHGNDYLILDTAGRLHIDTELMDELKRVQKTVTPDEILLVIDSLSGQDAVNVADTFNKTLEIDGVVLTKLDGDSRGGAALSVRAITGKPIKFAGVGEKLDDLEEFHPKRMASRILGMGDVLTLIEKAESALDEKKAMEMAKKIEKNKFDLEDLLYQMQEMKKLGSIKDVIGMIPGMSKKLQGVEIDEKIPLRNEAIIRSMTVKERKNPDLLNFSRKKRIAAGSGTSLEDINKVLKQYEEMKKMFKGKGKKGKFKGANMPNLPF